MTKEIPLTQGQVAIVDDCDYEYLSQFKWFAHRNKFTWYAQRNSSRANGRQTVIHMHRVILDAPPDLKVDHKDADGLNNIRTNLRLATYSQNNQNKRVSLSNTSGYKGVSWRKKTEKWVAQINSDGRRLHLGYFESAEEAAAKYDAVARELYGEFALTNSEAMAIGDISAAELA
jgi:hypothetical protein